MLTTSKQKKKNTDNNKHTKKQQIQAKNIDMLITVKDKWF